MIQFEKYEATANDFIMILDPEADIQLGADKIHSLCDRRRGIGADGLIILRKNEAADFQMLYYNADGKPGSMCGNGGRAALCFALDQHWIRVGENVQFLAPDGVHEGVITTTDQITLGMGVVDKWKSFQDGFFLDTGSPHLCWIVSDCEKVDVEKEGKHWRWFNYFMPGGTNVNFISEQGNGIRVRTFERGVEAETWSCGTGVTASAMAYCLYKDHRGSRKLAIYTKGGELEVRFHREGKLFDQVFLTGPAKKVFEGCIE